MEIFEKRPKQLKIIINEGFPTLRTLDNEEISQNEILTVKDFQHLYNIVKELLKIKYSNILTTTPSNYHHIYDKKEKPLENKNNKDIIMK